MAYYVAILLPAQAKPDNRHKGEQLLEYFIIIHHQIFYFQQRRRIIYFLQHIKQLFSSFDATCCFYFATIYSISKCKITLLSTHFSNCHVVYLRFRLPSDDDHEWVWKQSFDGRRSCRFLWWKCCFLPASEADPARWVGLYTACTGDLSCS